MKIMKEPAVLGLISVNQINRFVVVSFGLLTLTPAGKVTNQLFSLI